MKNDVTITRYKVAIVFQKFLLWQTSTINRVLYILYLHLLSHICIYASSKQCFNHKANCTHTYPKVPYNMVNYACCDPSSCLAYSWSANREWFVIMSSHFTLLPETKWTALGVKLQYLKRKKREIVRVLLCVSSVPASCVHIWFVSCPCLMSLWVNLCQAVCMWLYVNYPVYISPVFWVWFCLVYSLLPRCILSLSPALMSR